MGLGHGGCSALGVGDRGELGFEIGAFGKLLQEFGGMLGALELHGLRRRVAVFG